MLLDPSLYGRVGAVELAGNFGDGTTVMNNLSDGTALSRKRITYLLFPHGQIVERKRNLDVRFDYSSIGKI
jgi:hypothetical protein